MISIAILIPSTSRNTNWVKPQDSSLFNVILSFKNNLILKENIKIKYFIGIDHDDIFYKNDDVIDFYTKITDIVFMPVQIKKGHVTKIWNHLGSEALIELFDYMYICGDDIIQYTNGWLEESITVLNKNNNIGITGPYCRKNKKILTQMLIHRTHLDIFGFIYPEEIENWYCDDWINNIYEKNPIPSHYELCNTGGAERYNIIYCSELMKNLVERDKIVIKKYLENKNIL